jgi:GNAT superfamily N-acetyltransferase
MSDFTPIASEAPLPVTSETPARASVKTRALAARQTPIQAAPPDTSPHVRAARREDLKAIVAAVQDLLLELGGAPPAVSAMEGAARTLLGDPRSGALLVAQAGEESMIVGVLGASWQLAIHAPGRYALIQDLWVHPAWRGRAVGGELLGALFALARDWGITRVEVGLPRERFAGIRATEAFYLHNGFASLGARMRRTLP